MTKKTKVVFNISDVPFIESPDGTMRNSVQVTEETCGSQQYMAGLFFVRPNARSHADRHPGLEELYYIFEGRGQVVIDDKPHDIEAGDVVFIPDDSTHYLINNSSETLGLFYAIPTKWSNLPDVQQELGKWATIKLGSKWGSLQ